MKTKKGQAAMEFLMTYGWALLVVLAAIGALAYFGVFNMTSFLPEKCMLPSGLSCVDFQVTEDNAVFSIHNGIGYDIDDLTLTIYEDDDSPCVSSTISTVSDGEDIMISITNCTIGTGSYDSEMLMTYINSDSGLNHSKTGQLRVRVE